MMNNKINFNATTSLLKELIEIKSPKLVNNEKNSEFILEIIIFFVEFHNDKSEKYHVLILEKNKDEELDSLMNIKNNYKRSWWLMTQSTKFINNKNDKVSINVSQKCNQMYLNV